MGLRKLNPSFPHTRLKYRCAECDSRLSPEEGSGLNPRLCDYTGLSFCPGCHWLDRAVVPARAVRNWDFDPRPVSRAAAQYLALMKRSVREV